MYKHFFGFKEKPFKQAPNPEYLFLSKSHGEPLTHLSEDMDLHLVHVETFKTDSIAKWRLKSLKSLGFTSFMFTSKSKNGKTAYEVIAGKYQSYDLAKEASLSLSQKGQFNIVAKAKDFQN